MLISFITLSFTLLVSLKLAILDYPFILGVWASLGVVNYEFFLIDPFTGDLRLNLFWEFLAV